MNIEKEEIYDIIKNYYENAFDNIDTYLNVRNLINCEKLYKDSTNEFYILANKLFVRESCMYDSDEEEYFDDEEFQNIFEICRNRSIRKSYEDGDGDIRAIYLINARLSTNMRVFIKTGIPTMHDTMCIILYDIFLLYIKREIYENIDVNIGNIILQYLEK